MTTLAHTLGPIATSTPRKPAGAPVWTGHVLSGLAILFLIPDAGGKLLELPWTLGIFGLGRRDAR
jgi:hypothetical protein